ncbi:hypothetical protein ABZ260_33325 [Streptosporangium sp. NPDC006013]
MTIRHIAARFLVTVLSAFLDAGATTLLNRLPGNRAGCAWL